MKKFSIVVGLLAALALSVTVVAAMADVTVWLCNEKPITGTGNNRCLTLSENLTGLLLEDRGIVSAVECAVGSVLDEGWVGPGSEDETTSVTFMESTTNCKAAAEALNSKEEPGTNACIKVESVNPIGLPWKTLLQLVGGVTYDTLLTPGAGYAIKCSGIEDKCLVVAGKEPLIVLDNLALEGTEFPLVDVLFPTKNSELLKGKEELAECTLGGKEAGAVSGEDLLAAVNQTLETSSEP